jgi:hypothetical protein
MELRLAIKARAPSASSNAPGVANPIAPLGSISRQPCHRENPTTWEYRAARLHMSEEFKQSIVPFDASPDPLTKRKLGQQRVGCRAA